MQARVAFLKQVERTLIDKWINDSLHQPQPQILVKLRAARAPLKS
jgi:hypothetical protein